MKNLILMLLFAFYGASMQGQLTQVEAPRIKEINQYMAALRVSDHNVSNGFSKVEQLDKLLHKVQPSVYYYSGVVKTYGEKPTSLFTDIASLSSLANAAILKNNIDIVTIKINSAADLSGNINLSVLSGFKSLKYVYFISEVNVTEQMLLSKVTNMEDRLGVFYSVDSGDKNQ